jgi:hypothetical protein
MLFGRKASLSWQGEKHELTVTMELVESIDEEVNVLATAIELDKGGIPKITLVSKLYAVLLSAAGVSVTKEDVYESIMSSPADSADLVAAARYVIQLCFPQLETSERASGEKK